jgi:hypothetical protein
MPDNQTTPIHLDELECEIERQFADLFAFAEGLDMDTRELAKAREHQLEPIRRRRELVQKLAIVTPYGRLAL